MKEITDYGKVFETLVQKTQDYIVGNNLSAMVLGISGGIDSTVVAAICHEVSKRTNIPLIGISIPTIRKDIKTLEVRLRTRFEMGIIADISSPDYETRMAILRKKEELDGLTKYHIPNDVMQYIAMNINSNIRELEGSLNKLIFLHKLKNQEININLNVTNDGKENSKEYIIGEVKKLTDKYPLI